jgi:hypothetical protein
VPLLLDLATLNPETLNPETLNPETLWKPQMRVPPTSLTPLRPDGRWRPIFTPGAPVADLLLSPEVWEPVPFTGAGWLTPSPTASIITAADSIVTTADSIDTTADSIVPEWPTHTESNDEEAYGLLYRPGGC